MFRRVQRSPPEGLTYEQRWQWVLDEHERLAGGLRPDTSSDIDFYGAASSDAAALPSGFIPDLGPRDRPRVPTNRNTPQREVRLLLHEP